MKNAPILEIPKKRPTKAQQTHDLKRLISMGWVAAFVEDDEEPFFLKHFFLNEPNQAQRTLAQVVAYSDAGSGLYKAKRTSWYINQIMDLRKGSKQLKVRVGDLDVVQDTETKKYAQIGDEDGMTQDELLQYLLGQQMITPEETIFFTPAAKNLLSQIPHIAMDYQERWKDEEGDALEFA